MDTQRLTKIEFMTGKMFEYYIKTGNFYYET